MPVKIGLAVSDHRRDFIQIGAKSGGKRVPVEEGFGVGGCVPQYINLDAVKEPVKFMFRPRDVYKAARICVDVDGEEVLRGMYNAATIVPAVLFAVMLVLAVLYPLNKKTTQKMHEDLAKKHESMYIETV